MNGALRWMILLLGAKAALGAPAGTGAVASVKGAPAARPAVAPREKTTVFSNTRQFAVSGCPAAQGLEIALWADDVQARLGRTMGIAIAPPAPLPLVIRVIEDPAIQGGRVVRHQAIEGGMVDQQVEMINPASVDQEDLLEGVCALLLGRTAYIRARAPQSGIPRIPDWFAVGVAQNLFPEARARNRQAVLEAWRGRGVRQMREIVTWDRLPDGRWPEKPEAGIFLEWLLQPAKTTPRAAVLLDGFSSGRPVTAEWIATNVLGHADLTECERLRDLWIAQQQQVQVDPGTLTVDRVGELMRLLEIHPADFGIPPSDKVPLVTDLHDMIARRNDPWVKTLAANVTTKARLLAVGQPPEFSRVVEGYVAVFEGLARRSGGLFGGGMKPERLKLLLEEAETRLIAFKQIEKDRAQMRQRAQADTQPAVTVPALPGEDPVKAYLDEVERRLLRPAP